MTEKLKQGTVREDGKVFWRYNRGSEYWVAPEKFAVMQEEASQKQRKRLAAWTPEQRKKHNQYQNKRRADMTPEQRKKYDARTPEQRDQRNQKKREYKRQNSQKINAINHRRRALKLARLHPELDRAKEEAIHAQCIHLTHTTNILYHVDHIIPLSCGGWHHHDNLQCLPANLNLQKKDNPVWEHHGYKCWRDVPTHLWPEQLDKFYSSLLI